MGADAMKIPPPPPGFTLVDQNTPVPPPGFEIIGPGEAGPMPQSIKTPAADVNVNPESWDEFGRGVGLSAAQGLTFNYADELLAALASGVGYDREKTLEAVRDEEKKFKKRHPYISAGSEIAGSLGTGVGATVGTLRAIPRLANMAGVTGAMTRGAAFGAPMGAASATGATEGDESITDAALYGGLGGAAFGAGTGAVGAGLGRVIGPWMQPQAEQLRQAGVRLTPGEMIGGYGKRLEDSLGSAPFVGHMIRTQQQRGIESLNRVAIREALAPDVTLSRRFAAANADVGHDMIEEATRQLNRRYGEVVPRMSAQHMDPQLINDLRRIGARVPNSRLNDFRDAISRHIDDSVDPATGIISGRGLQNALGGLRDEARDLITSRASQAYDRDLGRALNLSRDALVSAARRRTNARTMGDFDRLQNAYAGFARIRDAASRTGADQGTFTPAQLSAAVRSGDQSAGRGAFARGQALLQNIAGPARSVMTRRVADSGTPERAALMGAILAPQTATAGIMAAAPAALLYTNAGRAVFERLATGAPQTRQLLQRLLEISARSGAPAAAVRPLVYD